MAQALQLIYGRVKYAANKPRQTTHGMRINCVISLPDGEEIKLWGDPGDPALTSLSKGQQVQLAKNALGNWQLATTAPAEPTPQPAQSQNTVQNHTDWTPEQKRAIASRIEERAKLMRFCLEQARKHCGDYLETSEDLRAIATTFFLEALKG
jgi:hypothetical protein